ncbi:hypothetical protein BN1708_017975, partial [Verticillium longisporum]
MDAFVEQLDSTDVDVQTSAGFNIAFIFEAARDHEEETGEVMNLQYDPKRLISRMAEASKPAAKGTSRKDRRHLRKNFASIEGPRSNMTETYKNLDIERNFASVSRLY